MYNELLQEFGIHQLNPGVSTGISWLPSDGPLITSSSPIDGCELGSVYTSDYIVYNRVIEIALHAFKSWKLIPAPKRGEIVRQIGQKLRQYKKALGKLIIIETGKPIQEGLGEVQEMIDICDYAVGLSRQLYGLTMHSERPMHRMYEQYHPLGPVGIITSFNFPMAVWSWNFMIALVCGDVCIWKPSEKTPLSAIACQNVISDIFRNNKLPEGICNLVNGDYQAGELISNDSRIPLVSATGSTKMGKSVGKAVSVRLGKTILELGGNNAVIISPYADLNLALISSVFGAVGTAGQRCTTTRRLIIHESIFDDFTKMLVKGYQQLKIGNPLDENIHVGPLIDKQAVENYLAAIKEIKSQGGKVIIEGVDKQGTKGYYSYFF